MIIDTGRRLTWTFMGIALPSIHAVPIPEPLTRRLKVEYSDAREAERTRGGGPCFRDVLAALDDPRLAVFHPARYVNLGLEVHQDYVLGRPGKGEPVLIELVLRERSNEEAGYVLEMVEVLDARTHPDWLAQYRARGKKGRR